MIAPSPFTLSFKAEVRLSLRTTLVKAEKAPRITIFAVNGDWKREVAISIAGIGK